MTIIEPTAVWMSASRQRTGRSTALALSIALAVGTFVTVASSQAPATDSARVAQIMKVQKELEERNKTFRFGLSLGWRHMIGDQSSFYRDAVLNPEDGKVEVDTIDQGDVVLSGVAVAFPWKKPDPGAGGDEGGWHWRLGFIANIDLASFANEELTVFNRSLEGGGGLVLRLSDDFSLALTVERVISRRLRSFVTPGEPLPVAAGSQPKLSRGDDQYFRNDNLTALSFKYVYFFN